MSVLLLSACTEEVLFETQVLVIAETENCEEARAERPVPTMNAYQVAVLALDENAVTAADEVPCGRCVNSGACEVVDLRCSCGRPRLLSTNAINEALDGLRFPSLEPTQQYCVVLSSFSVPEVRRPDGESECPCNFGDVNLTGRGRMCGVSPFPSSVQENAPAVVIAAECSNRCGPLTD